MLDSVSSSVRNRRQYSGIPTYFHPQVAKVGRRLRSWARRKEIFLNTDYTNLVKIFHKVLPHCVVLYSTAADLLDGDTDEPKYVADALKVVSCVMQTAYTAGPNFMIQ